MTGSDYFVRTAFENADFSEAVRCIFNRGEQDMRKDMISTKDLTREEWLELRRGGIGGSDASVVMRKNPWRSILQLWEDKTGKLASLLEQ